MDRDARWPRDVTLRREAVDRAADLSPAPARMRSGTALRILFPSLIDQPARRRVPAEFLERHASACIEQNALTLEKQSLPEPSVTAGAETHHPTRIDHSLPWHGRRARQCVQGVAHETRLARESGERGDLAVRRDAPPRNSPNNSENPLMGRRSARGRTHATAAVARGM